MDGGGLIRNEIVFKSTICKYTGIFLIPKIHGKSRNLRICITLTDFFDFKTKIHNLQDILPRLPGTTVYSCTTTWIRSFWPSSIVTTSVIGGSYMGCVAEMARTIANLATPPQLCRTEYQTRQIDVANMGQFFLSAPTMPRLRWSSRDTGGVPQICPGHSWGAPNMSGAYLVQFCPSHGTRGKYGLQQAATLNPYNKSLIFGAPKINDLQ